MTRRTPALRPLPPGGCIGLISPSGAIHDPAITPESVAHKLRAAGYRVKLGASVGARYGYLAGTDALRAQDLHAMFADPEVDAVWCARGGYGATRLLTRIDWDLLRAHPKLLIGYSDVTALHLAIHRLCGYPTLHAPMPALDSFSPEADPFAWEAAFHALRCAEPLGTLRLPDGAARPTGHPGASASTAEGLLVGGNLSLVASLCGTPYLPDMRGKILFLEDVGEKTYALDRMLTQLRLAGLFADCAAVVLGDYTNCPVEHPDFGLTLAEIVRDVVLPCGKPVLTGLPAGHCSPTLTLPLGIPCRVDTQQGTLSFPVPLWQPYAV